MYEHPLMERIRAIADALATKVVNVKVEPSLSEYPDSRQVGNIEIAGVPFFAVEPWPTKGRIRLKLAWPNEPSYGTFTDGKGDAPEITFDPSRDPTRLAADIMRRLVNGAAPRYAVAVDARDSWVKGCKDAFAMVDILAKVHGKVQEGLQCHFVVPDLVGVEVSVPRTHPTARIAVEVSDPKEAREVYAAIVAALTAVRATNQGEA